MTEQGRRSHCCCPEQGHVGNQRGAEKAAELTRGSDASGHGQQRGLGAPSAQTHDPANGTHGARAATTRSPARAGAPCPASEELRTGSATRPPQPRESEGHPPAAAPGGQRTELLRAARPPAPEKPRTTRGHVSQALAPDSSPLPGSTVSSMGPV